MGTTHEPGAALALSLWQPHATLLAMGPAVKPHETRSWPPWRLGTLLIHASLRVDRVATEAAAALFRGERMSPPPCYPLGAFVGVGRVVTYGRTDGFFAEAPEHALDRAFGDWAPGRYAWRLAHVVAFEPVPARGQQGLWSPDPETVAACRAACRAALGRMYPKSPENAAVHLGLLFPGTEPAAVPAGRVRDDG